MRINRLHALESRPTMITTPRQHPLWAVILLIALLMLPNLVWLYRQPILSTWITGFVMPTLLMAMLFALSGKRVWIACLLLTPFAVLALPESIYVFTYLRPTNAEILGTLFATSPREAYEYLGKMMIPVVASLLFGFTIVVHATRQSYISGLSWKSRIRSWLLAAAATIPIAAASGAFLSTNGNFYDRSRAALDLFYGVGESVESSFPFGFPQRITEYITERAQLESQTKMRDAFRFHAKRLSSLPSRQIYVLVIGESSRRNHWQLFGYGRATNPELSKINNLIKIPDMVTSWPATIMAVPLMITRKPLTDAGINWKEASIMRAMSEAGFETYWISNQLAIGKYDSPVSTYAYEAEHVSFLNHASWTASGSYDEVLIEPLRDAIARSKKDLFIVLHMMGSHGNYDFRYPASFKHFSPTTSDPGSDNQFNRIGNSYDNSVLYTDYVLSKIVDVLNNSKAITALLYESDHGEDLASQSCTISGHGNGTPYDFQIPAFLWYSNAYALAFPEKLASFRINSTKRSLSADTFYSLIDMANISVPNSDQTFSLFDQRWKYHTRFVNGYWKTDFDNSIVSEKCKLLLPKNGQEK
jgi:glucan phosphoethanolaminetransferase (alkaline phosphatase superfamily)